MTAVAEAEHDLKRDASTVTETELLDVLYEVIAQGVDPKGELTVAEVERFLHEHARSQKPLSEMLAFFARHGLPTDASAYAADPELGELASGLHRERGPVSAMFPLDADAEPIAETRTNPQASAHVAPEPVVAVVADEISGVKRHAPAPVAARRTPWLRIAVATLGIGLCAAFAFSYLRAHELETKLRQARLQQRSTDLALTALEQRAEGLRSALTQSEAERAGLSSRFDSFLQQEGERRAAEEQALRQLLGPRYETLRARALATPTP